MWIPDHSRPEDVNVRMAIQAGAIAFGRKPALEALYLQLMNEFPEGVPATVRVLTHHYKGGGLQITPILAHHANEAGLLGEQCSKVEHGFGATNYSRSFYWRVLDAVKLYSLLADESLPAPKATEDN